MLFISSTIPKFFNKSTGCHDAILDKSIQNIYKTVSQKMKFGQLKVYDFGTVFTSEVEMIVLFFAC